MMAATAGCLAACSSDATDPDGVDVLDPDIPPVTEGEWYRPAVTDRWQWQLQGTINRSYDVEAYDVDLFDVPATVIELLHTDGRSVICYFSAGSFEPFRSDAEQFQAAELGNALEGFESERWLDIRSGNVLTIMQDRLNMAVQKGCDGVEPDNVDGYTNDTGFPLTADDQLAFNRRIANAARERGLGVALKNDLDQIPQLLAYFDFHVNEQCHEFEECDVAAAFVASGKPVFNAEYESRLVTDPTAREQVCDAASAVSIHTLILPLDLDDSFRFSCDP